MPKRKDTALYARIREILESARAGVARTVNTTQVMANWLIGREIVEEEQRGKKRADYGRKLLASLSSRLRADFGRGYSVDNLEAFRLFYLSYPALISATQSRKLPGFSKSETLSRISNRTSRDFENWEPGVLHPAISWSHYRVLLKISEATVRGFYEVEAVENAWSIRELERQINSLLYERLAKSWDKEGMAAKERRDHKDKDSRATARMRRLYAMIQSLCYLFVPLRQTAKHFTL